MKTKNADFARQDAAKPMAAIFEVIQGGRDSLLFSHRALGTGLAVLGMSDAELRDAMSDDDRFAMICQIFKMLHVDLKYAEIQASLRERAIDRITLALVERQHPDTESLLISEIDFASLPDAPGIDAAQVNAVRPTQATAR